MEQRIGKIVLYQRLDRAALDAMLTAGDDIVLDIERRYVINDLPDAIAVTLPEAWPATGGFDFVESLVNVIEAAAWSHEQDCLVWNVAYDADGKAFDLSGSYVRTSIDSADGAAIDDGSVLLARFTTPALPAAVNTVLTLPYGEALDSAELAALEVVGIEIELGATGTAFAIKTQKVPFQVQFYRPADALKNYVMNFPLAGQIIEI